MSVAETVLPSVRGRARRQVALVLAGTAASTGALVGFAVGVLWLVAPFPEAGAGASTGTSVSPGASASDATGAAGRGTAAAALAVVVTAAAALDGFGVRPPSIRRQVPQAWARLLPLPVAAALYGARLGVGPLTVLNTWLWWAAAVLGAWAGPWWSTAVGGVFGLARIAVLVPVSAGLGIGDIGGDDHDGAGRAMAARMARVRRSERVTQRVTAGTACALALVVVLVLGACTGGGGDGKAGTGRDKDRSSSAARTADRDGDGDGTGSTSGTGDTDNGGAAGALAALLPPEVGASYERIADSARPGLGALDLDEAAEAEVDTSAERSVLETRRFRRGAARAWRSTDDAAAIDEVYVAVYEFADAKGAAAYLGDGLVTLEGRAATQYAVEGVEGATGFSQAERRPDGALTTHGVVFARGAWFFLVLTASPRPGSTPTEAAALARTLDARQAAARAQAAVAGR